MAGEQNSNQSSQQSGSQQQAADSAGSNGASNQTNQQNSQQQAAAPVRPDAFADKAFDSYFDPKDGVKFADLARDFSALRAEKAQSDLRRAGVPAKADDYKLALPQTFELPKGADGKPIEFQFDDADPRLPAARAWAHKNGLDQATFSDLLAIQVQADLADRQMVASGRTKEQEKLGVNGPARIDALSTMFSSMIGTDKAKAIMDRMVLASDIEALEDLAKKISNPGGSNFTQQHREGGKNGKLTEEEYQRLPLSERRQYQLNGGQRAN